MENKFYNVALSNLELFYLIELMLEERNRNSDSAYWKYISGKGQICLSVYDKLKRLSAGAEWDTVLEKENKEKSKKTLDEYELKVLHKFLTKFFSFIDTYENTQGNALKDVYNKLEIILDK